MAYNSTSPPAPGLIAIYALHDPRDGRLRYIGSTARPAQRWRQFLSHRPRQAHLAAWWDELKPIGLEPVMNVIAWVPGEFADEAEVNAIRDARRAGAALLNENLVGAGRSWGALHKLHRDGHKLPPEEKALLENLAPAGGGSLGHARLLARIERHRKAVERYRSTAAQYRNAETFLGEQRVALQTAVTELASHGYSPREIEALAPGTISNVTVNKWLGKGTTIGVFRRMRNGSRS